MRSVNLNRDARMSMSFNIHLTKENEILHGQLSEEGHLYSLNIRDFAWTIFDTRSYEDSSTGTHPGALKIEIFNHTPTSMFIFVLQRSFPSVFYA